MEEKAQLEAQKKAQLKWIVDNRNAIQTFLLDLYNAGESPGSHGTLKADVFQMLVGIGFSLWRAVFLIEVGKPPTKTTGMARKFLLKIIQTNAIGFSNEESNRAWTAGYYLNNAYYRLAHTYTSLLARGITELNAASMEAVVTYLEQHGKVGEREAREASGPDTYTAHWETAYEAAKSILAVLPGLPAR